MNESLLNQLESSLNKDQSDLNIGKWVSYIIEEDIALVELLPLLYKDQKTGMRFSWLIGSLCEQKPQLVYPIVRTVFSKRHEVPFKNFERSLAKIFWLVKIPEDMEGLVTDELFNWLLNPKLNVTTKCYAISALEKLAKKYPDLKSELTIAINDQIDKNSISFQQRAKRILANL